jgi:hypothetical protein
MKYTILFVFAALAMSLVLLACSSSKNNNSDNAALERKGMESSIDVKALSQQWKHVKTKDSYDGIWKEIDSDNKVITFSESGEYKENKPGNDLCEGVYVLEGERVVLTHSCNKVAQTCKVVSLEAEKLVLGMQGRHGEVLYVYEKVK